MNEHSAPSQKRELLADGSWDIGKYVTDLKIMQLRREGNGGVE